MTAKRKGLTDKLTESFNKIQAKEKSSLANNFNILKIDKKLPEQPSNRATEQATEQPNNRTTEQLPEQPNNRTTEQLSEQPSNRATEQPTNIDSLKKPSNLKLHQWQILRYIYFNRPFKVKGNDGLSTNLNIKYGTVRNSLNSLVRKGYIHKPFSINDGINNGSTCVVDELKCLKLFGLTKTEQPNNRTTEQAPEQPNNRTTEQPNSSYNKERKIINLNLSLFEFWKSQGLTDFKFQEWCKEFSFTRDEWEIQLLFGENEPKVTQADIPIKYFYKSLQKGGLVRPAGFEFPAEKQAIIQQDENKRREDLIQLKKKNRKKEQELADQESFLLFLDDKDTVEALVKKIADQFTTPNMKISIKNYFINGNIDLRLEVRLKQFFLKF